MPADDKYRNQSTLETPTAENEDSEEQTGVEQDIKDIFSHAPSLAFGAKHDKEAYEILYQARHNLTEITLNPAYRQRVKNALSLVDKVGIGINSRLGNPELYRQINSALYAADKVFQSTEKSPEYASIREKMKSINEQEK